MMSVIGDSICWHYIMKIDGWSIDGHESDTNKLLSVSRHTWALSHAHGFEQPRVPPSMGTRRMSMTSLGSGVSCSFCIWMIDLWIMLGSILLCFLLWIKKKVIIIWMFHNDMVSSILLAFQNQSLYIPPMCSKLPAPTLQVWESWALLSSDVQCLKVSFVGVGVCRV